MANLHVSVKIDDRKLRSIMASEIDKALKRATDDVVDDLIRVSSEIAPHDKGVLEKSHYRDVHVSGGKAVAEVTYSVTEESSNGRYNYAMAMHELDYNLGPGSLAKPGTEGMSGKHYGVGNKYLTRPLEGEKEVYGDHIAEEIRKELR